MDTLGKGCAVEGKPRAELPSLMSTFKTDKKEDEGNYKMISIISRENNRAKLHTIYFQAPKGQEDHHMLLRRGERTGMVYPGGIRTLEGLKSSMSVPTGTKLGFQLREAEFFKSISLSNFTFLQSSVRLLGWT